MKNILIIEDDYFTKEFYKVLLKKAGFNILILEDGDIIIKKLQSDDFNLIIMDIILRNSSVNGSKVNGIQLAKYIKQNISKFIPVLLISAFSPEVKMTKFLEESFADDFILKPITDLNLFLKKINGLIK
jgi:CheY-like chemotaxis protein